MGMYDIVGFGGDTFVGLPRSQLRRDRRSARQGRGTDRYESRMGRRNNGPPMSLGSTLVQSSQRVEPFGVGFDLAVAASGVFSFSAIAQKPVQPIGMVVGSDSLPSIVITDVKIGTISQLGGVGQVPAQMFQGDGTQNGFSYSPAGPGVTIQVTGQNVDAANPHAVTVGMRVVAAVAA